MRFKNKNTGNVFNITEPAVLKLVKNDEDFEMIDEKSDTGEQSKEGQKTAGGADENKPLSARSSTELKAMAKEAKIPGYSGMSKDNLIAALEKAAKPENVNESSEGGGSADGNE